MAKKRLIIISNRLPFQLVRNHRRIELKESDGGLVSALKSYFERKLNSRDFSSTVWIGSADFSETEWRSFKRPKTSLGYEVEPLFIDKKLYNKYYNGFCNSTLWPLFHYFPSFVEFNHDTFDAYEETTGLFADKILSVLRPNDVVWIHDYQLLLLPGLLRERKPDATIGFFLHIPFPSFELFRLLHRPWKEKIINGLLGADLIGFHTHEYVQHFLKTVQMIKGYDHEFRTIFTKNRIVKTDLFPLGIDFEKFNSAVSFPQVIGQRQAIENNFPGKKIIFSVDRLDYTKGITHRLSGFEHFLKLYPEWLEKIIFILVVVPSRQIVSKYNERKKLIEEEIGRINGKYSTLQWQPIIYRYSQLSFHELTAMYNVSDVALITPLRDGMNLVSKEYIASSSPNGVLILSELAGAASELGEAILINPMDKEEMAHAIHEAITMPVENKKNKREQLQQRLKEYTVIQWINDFVKQLDEVKSQQCIQRIKHLSEDTISHIQEKFKSAKRRLLLLDYDGTLVPFSKHPHLAVPDAKLLNNLQAIASDPRTDVTIISGRESEFLQKWFGDLPINLVAEHGAGIRLKNEDWKFNVNDNQSWKAVILPLLEMFKQRSPGSFIEEKAHTLVWHYRNVDTELGFNRSRELLDNLRHLAHNSRFNIIDGNRVIEVRTSGIDKGMIAQKLTKEEKYDFVLAIGDDKTDEDMFKVLQKMSITIKVGTGHTAAKYSVVNQTAALRLVAGLTEFSASLNNIAQTLPTISYSSNRSSN